MLIRPEHYDHEFVWAMDVRVTNNYGDERLINIQNSATYTGAATEQQVEKACLDWVVDELDEDVTSTEVIRFTWSSIPAVTG